MFVTNPSSRLPARLQSIHDASPVGGGPGVIPIPRNVQLTRPIVDVTGTIVTTATRGFALRFAEGAEPILFGERVGELPIFVGNPAYERHLREHVGQPHRIYGAVDRLPEGSLRVTNIYPDDPIYIGYLKGELLIEIPSERRDEAEHVLASLGASGFEWHQSWTLVRFAEGEEQRFIEALQRHPELFLSSTLNHWAVIPRGRVTSP
jgi:hypothetical protein